MLLRYMNIRKQFKLILCAGDKQKYLYIKANVVWIRITYD